MVIELPKFDTVTMKKLIEQEIYSKYKETDIIIFEDGTI